MKKTVVEVTISSNKCNTSIMTTVAKLDGIESMKLDEKKSRLIVVGDVDPVAIIEALRKKKKQAKILSVGPYKPEKGKSMAGSYPYIRPSYPYTHQYDNWSDTYRSVPYVNIPYHERPSECVIV